MSGARDSSLMVMLKRALMIGPAKKPGLNTNVRIEEEKRHIAPAKRSGFQGSVNRFFFNAKERASLYDYMSSQLTNGRPGVIALEHYRDRMLYRKRRTIAAIVADIIRRAKQNGGSFSVSFQPWAPMDEIRIIDSGEKASDLAGAFDMIIELNERKAELMGKLRGAAAMPIGYMIIIYLLLLFVGIYITPTFTKYLPNPTGVAVVLYAEGQFVDSWESLIPPILIVMLGIAFQWSLARWTGKHRARLDNFLPYSFYRDFTGFVWFMTFLAQLKSKGSSDTEIIRNQMGRANPWLKERLKLILPRLSEEGGTLPLALKLASIKGVEVNFPNVDLIDAIESVYGQADTIPRLQVISKKWAVNFDKETAKKIKNFSMIAQLVVYSIITFVLLAMNAVSQQMTQQINFH